jgi:O-succinylbenzoic acid--CoA ligase
MADGYLDDPAATAAAFKEGWFHSGDWGALVGARRLRLVGRHDGLLNIGGIKVAASGVEQRIRAFTQVRDCAVLAVNLPDGATVGIVLVVEPGTQREQLARQFAQALGLGAATVARIVFVENLPRTTGGKVDRAALHRLLA